MLEHVALGAHGQLCSADGSIASDELRAAHAEVTAELEAARGDVEAQRVLEVPRLLEIYRDYTQYLVSCPQAVMQATIAKLEGLLQQLRSMCSTMELIRPCQATTPFMFDVFIYYLLLKYGVVDAYANLGNVTSQEVFRGWPIEEHEQRTWFLFGALWRVIWPARDYCACVEAYDYYTTMHALFDGSLHIGRGDLHERLLRPSSEARRMVEAASYCEEWLEKDFQRIFSTYAKFSACLPGALMENIVCLQRWLLGGKVIGSLNTAEMMVKLLTLSDTCLEDTRWPFSKADVEYNFARLAVNWRAGNVNCQAMDRFGQRLQDDGCPSALDATALRPLLWSPSPLQQNGRQVQCTAQFDNACIVNGIVTVRKPPDGEARLPDELQTCSETGRNRHRLALSEDLGHLWGTQEEAVLQRQTVGFVLNLPETGDNVWHNLHWIVPAAARLHGPRAQESLGDKTTRDVLLILLFDAYLFRENKPDLENGSDVSEADADREKAEQQQRFELWVVRHAPFLRLLTTAPPVMLHTVQRRCFGRLLWGHAEMRADRELRHGTAVGPEEVQAFKDALNHHHAREMDELAHSFWQRSPLPAAMGMVPDKGSHISVIVIQRAFDHGRSFLDLPNLTARALEPLTSSGAGAWRVLDDLEQRPLLQQAALFRSTDVLVGAVGAALAWMLLMPAGGQVLEWLPQGVQPSLYRCSEAWNEDTLGMFGGLGRLANVDHVCLRSEGTPVQIPDSKRFSATRTTAKDAFWRQTNLETLLNLRRLFTDVDQLAVSDFVDDSASATGQKLKHKKQLGFGLGALQHKAEEASRAKKEKVKESNNQDSAQDKSLGCEEPPESIEGLQPSVSSTSTLPGSPAPEPVARSVQVFDELQASREGTGLCLKDAAASTARADEEV
ncbi:Kcnb2 [Symbiodinium natans]|uniref:Kcnb2 protein n=1 Tax=Symbiodinium natans TaxID=878477 RepID=A0A812JCI7_9DINO|nr:Kcnb2 [Symbiodinium natans]